MKRGFLNKGASARRLTTTKSSATSGSDSAEKPMQLSRAGKDTVVAATQGSKFQFSGVCRLHSNSPRIIVSDYRIPSFYATHFLYLPSADNATMVYIDSLKGVQTVSAWPLWTQPAPSPPANPPFEIRECDDKGLGMIALRRIARGEVIVRQRPLLFSHPTLHINPDQMHTFFESALAGLSPDTQSAFNSLRNAQLETEDVPRSRGIILTNALATQVPQSHDPTANYNAVFASLSRANHDCSPNAHYSFSAGTFTGRLTALRIIQPGEEITLGYTDIELPRAQRRQVLATKFKFDCGCTTCCLSPKKATESDTRRAAIAAFLIRINELNVNTTEGTEPLFPEGASLARASELLRWAEGERLIEAASKLAMAAAGLAYKENNTSETTRLALRAINYLRAEEGNDSPHFVRFARGTGFSPEQMAAKFDSSSDEEMMGPNLNA
ncbi:hypothetical protein B0H16DRAFT_1425528 [Mycena metata]|uniref:SET domain-containing protein n=1 Tax=Mycena metata TaxID=1033252 RepID=A0AAD7MXX7_9AGAR|nr:hypothetical protein B0H16DRAFT_1425528 [Mycena metata]